MEEAEQAASRLAPSTHRRTPTWDEVSGSSRPAPAAWSVPRLSFHVLHEKLTPPAQKLKANLIEAAKVKKQYAKVLAAEGMSSTRLKRDPDAPAPAAAAASSSKRSSETKGKSAAKPKRHDPFAAPKSDDDFSDSDEEDDDDDEDAVGGRSGSEDEDETPDDRRVRSRAGPAPGDNDDRRRTRAGPAPGDEDRRRNRAGPAPSSGPSRSPGAELKRQVSHPYKLQPRKRDDQDGKGKGKFDGKKFGKGKAVEREAPAPPAEPLPSLRTMKRDAFSKHHDKSSAPRGALGSARRGQPNMGSRMDMLLEKIKRSKA